MGLVGNKTAVASFVVIIAIAANHYRNQKTLSPVLEISQGKLQGIVSYTREGKEVYEYLKIPFAKPPVADLRFEPPQPAEPWTGLLDASEHGPLCIQVSLLSQKVDGEEDCLFLNVYTPAKRQGLLPVMVWFHGGAFVFGGSSRYKPAYLLDEDIILVTVQYRLAALGFLNTGDNASKGNMGLKDQTMALKWVQQNIKSFGGDESQVTITGESAGAASVGFHLISPLSKGLFTRAIMESGSPFSNWAMYRDPAKQAKRYADKFNCSSEGGSKEMVECLKQIDAHTFVEGHKEILLPLREKITLFSPTVETVIDAGTFLEEEPLEALMSGRVNKVPLIIGANEDEGLLTSAIVTANQTKLIQANTDWTLFASRLLGISPSKTDILQKIKTYYFGTIPDIGSIKYIQNYTNLFSDRQFFVPMRQFGKLFGKYSPVRMYYYKYNAEFSLGDILAATQSERVPAFVSVIWEIANKWIHRKLGMPLPNLGVCHGDELQLLFNWGLSQYIGKGHGDYEMSKKMVQMWADFMKNKNTLSIDDVTWEEVKKEGSLQYLIIDGKSSMGNEPFTERAKFWEKLNV